MYNNERNSSCYITRVAFQKVENIVIEQYTWAVGRHDGKCAIRCENRNNFHFIGKKAEKKVESRPCM